jgi:folate-dependent phosphoribosylglycinamide formyltransferase PurN
MKAFNRIFAVVIFVIIAVFVSADVILLKENKESGRPYLVEVSRLVKVIKNGDTPETLQKRIMEEAEWKILPYAVKLFCDDKIEIRNGLAVVSE